MKIVVLIALIAALYSAYEAVRIRPLLQASQRLIEAAKPFARETGGSAILVLGDSTALGVGASKSEDTVAGRVAALHPEWSVENYAVSGAQIEDLTAQFAQAQREQYALAIIHIGANDIIRFKSAASAARDLEPLLASIKEKSEKVVFLTAGNVGGSTFFPAILNPFYERRTLHYHAAFENIAKRLGIVYVNLYAKPENDPFLKDPLRFFSADGLHPSSEGYELWFEKVRAEI